MSGPEKLGAWAVAVLLGAGVTLAGLVAGALVVLAFVPAGPDFFASEAFWWASAAGVVAIEFFIAWAGTALAARRLNRAAIPGRSAAMAGPILVSGLVQITSAQESSAVVAAVAFCAALGGAVLGGWKGSRRPA